MAYFFVYPFGQDGDLTAVPTDTQPSGSVSYQSGFPIDYEKNLLTDPTAKPVPRDQTNQLYFDITTAIRQYQTDGTPDWITAADNNPGGVPTPFPYDIYARVRYDAGGGMKVYENQVAANTATPGADSTWLVISGNTGGVPVGTVIDFASPLSPTGYITCDGSAISRATYVNLYEAITFTQTGTTTNTLYTITGLSDTSNMYPGMIIECANVGGAVIVSVDSGTQITLDTPATASGANTVRFFMWGNGDGGSTFNVPDLRRQTSIGSGGSGSAVIGNKTGQTGGAESHTLTKAELPDPICTTAENHSAASGTDFGAVSSSLGYGTGTVSNSGGGQAHSIMQPSRVMNKCIKY